MQWAEVIPSQTCDLNDQNWRRDRSVKFHAGKTGSILQTRSGINCFSFNEGDGTAVILLSLELWVQL